MAKSFLKIIVQSINVAGVP